MSAVRSRTLYGRACSHCAKAKAKCTLRSRSQACERCFRLKKDCQPTTGVRHKPGRKPGSSKASQLEERLNGLIAMLETVPGIEQGDLSRVSSSSSSHGQLPEMRTDSRHDGLVPHSISPSEATACLQAFRARVKCFPFVHVPDTVSAAQLQHDRPLLWLSITASCAPSASHQRALVDCLRARIADQALVQNIRSLDLLQGLLGFLGWGMYYSTHDSFMLMYSHIVSALVQDLGLDRSPTLSPRRPQLQPPQKPSSSVNRPATPAEDHPLALAWEQGPSRRTSDPPTRTMEERRAVLASYLISALVSQFQSKQPSLLWTEHMDESLCVLHEQPETPLDRILVYQVRLQRIALDIPHPASYANMTSAEHMRIVREFQVAALCLRLQEVKQSLPEGLSEDLALFTHISAISVEISIHAVALYATSASSQPSRQRIDASQGTSHSHPYHLPDGQSDIQRHDMLVTCLSLARKWCDAVFMQPPAVFFALFSFHMSSQIAYVFVAMYRLAGFRDPGVAEPSAEAGPFRCHWDRHLARRLLNIPSLLEALAQRFEDAPPAAGFATDCEAGTTDVFTRWAQAARNISAAWQAAWARDPPEPEAQGAPDELREVPHGPERPEQQSMPPVLGVDDMDRLGTELFGLGGDLSSWMVDIFTLDWGMES